MALRDYQIEAVRAIYGSIGSGRGLERPPVCVVPTGAGKSHIIAKICLDTINSAPEKNVLVLTHQKEILLQNAAKLKAALGSDDLLSFYCAGIDNKKDPTGRVVYASIQSCVHDAALLHTPTHKISVVIVDEAHRIPEAKESQYQRFLSSLFEVAGTRFIPIIGFTATPFRTNDGLICGDEETKIFKTVCYQLPVQRLVDGGYLTPLKTYVGEGTPDLSHVRMEHGEYKASDLEVAYCSGDNTPAACRDLVERVRDRRRILVFCCTVNHAEFVKHALGNNTSSQIESIFGETPKDERKRLLDWFVEDTPDQRFLLNVGVLTTGYDAPIIDAVALLRATASASLYVQMVGRGMRLFPGKKDCLVLDYGDNIRRLGSLRELELTHGFTLNAYGEWEHEKREGQRTGRSCPVCGFYNDAAVADSVCPDCGSEYPKREAHTTAEASELDVMGGETEVHDYIVRGETFATHFNPRSGSTSIVIMHDCYGCAYPIRQYVFWEHPQWPTSKASRNWLATRLDNVNCPESISAEEIAEAGNIGFPMKATKIRTIKTPAKKWRQVIETEHGPTFLPDPDDGDYDVF